MGEKELTAAGLTAVRDQLVGRLLARGGIAKEEADNFAIIYLPALESFNKETAKNKSLQEMGVIRDGHVNVPVIAVVPKGEAGIIYQISHLRIKLGGFHKDVKAGGPAPEFIIGFKVASPKPLLIPLGSFLLTDEHRHNPDFCFGLKWEKAASARARGTTMGRIFSVKFPREASHLFDQKGRLIEAKSVMPVAQGPSRHDIVG